MSVMNGFREELIKSLSGINGDFIIYESTDKEISKLQQAYPDAKIVKNYQQRVITTNDRGIEGLLMKSMAIEDFYKIPRLNENLFEIENNILMHLKSAHLNQVSKYSSSYIYFEKFTFLQKKKAKPTTQIKAKGNKRLILCQNVFSSLAF